MKYDLPNEEDRVYPERGTQGMLKGLKEAQEELEGFNQYEDERDAATPLNDIDESVGEQGSFLSSQTQDEVELCLASYAKRIQEEKSAFQEAKTFIEESRDKIDKRLERINQLEEAVKKTRENMRVINTELNEGKEFHEEFSRQIKEKLGIT